MATKPKSKADSADNDDKLSAKEPTIYNTDSKDPAVLYPLIRDAWNAVRGDDGVEFDACQHQFKHDLLAHAVSALNSGEILGGDGYWARFEAEIARLKHASDKAVEAQAA